MSSGWLKLGAFSLVGLIVSFLVLGFTSTINPMGNMNGMNMQGVLPMQMNGVNMQGTMPANPSGMNMQGIMPVNNAGMNMTGAMPMPMNNSTGMIIPVGMPSAQMNNMGYMGAVSGQTIENQLYQLQMQINQIQQQLMNSNSGNSGSMSGGMSMM